MEEGFKGRGKRSLFERLDLRRDHEVSAELVCRAPRAPGALAGGRGQIDEILVRAVGKNEQQRPLPRVPRDAAGEGIPEQWRRSGVYEQGQMALARTDSQTICAGEPFGEDRS